MELAIVTNYHSNAVVSHQIIVIFITKKLNSYKIDCTNDIRIPVQ